MDESNEVKFIVSDINIIYKPEPKRLCKKYLKLSNLSHGNKIKKQKHKKSNENINLKLKKKDIVKSQNLDEITFEEIENDFKLLKAKSEIFEVENELLKLLKNATKDSSFDEEERKNKMIESPKNIFYKNIE